MFNPLGKTHNNLWGWHPSPPPPSCTLELKKASDGNETI